ncbi:MAG TPA: carbohydrate ABC transporter permease, partial [Bacilli bacterium]
SANAALEISKMVSSDEVLSKRITPYSIQLATLVVAIGPIVLIYPFFQKYFVKGFLIGALKE